MSWLEMPPLSALRAFSVFAAVGNVSRAGSELNVSHAAISQQIRSLETHLGVALVNREGRALKLTEAGRHLAQALEAGFDTIRSGVQDVSARESARPLHISCTPMFALNWLMPRLQSFRVAHPEVDLMLNPTADVVSLGPGHADLAIRYGTGDWAGCESDLLLASPIVVVAAPSLLQGRKVVTPRDLIDLPKIEELGTTEVSDWFNKHGVEEPDDERGGRMQLPGNLLIEATLSGQGIAVKVEAFAARYIADGRLVELFRDREDCGYYIVHTRGVLRPAAKAFVTWLRREKRSSGGAT